MKTHRTLPSVTNLALTLAAGIALTPPSAEAMIIRDLPLSTQNGDFTTDPILRVKVQEKGAHKLRFTFKNLGGGSINDIFFEKGLFTSLLRRNTSNARVLPFSQGVSFAKRSDVPKSAKSFTQLRPHDAEDMDWQGQPLSFHALGTDRVDRINNGLKIGDKLHVYVPKRNGVTLADLEAVLFDQPGRITWAAEEVTVSGITTGSVDGDFDGGINTGSLTGRNFITTGGAMFEFVSGGTLQINHTDLHDLVATPPTSFDITHILSEGTFIDSSLTPTLFVADPITPAPSVAASTLICGGLLLTRRRRAI